MGFPSGAPQALSRRVSTASLPRAARNDVADPGEGEGGIAGTAPRHSDEEPLGSGGLPPTEARILLVDDTPANLLALEVVLEPLGHPLVTARSGDEALHMLASQTFALIVLDVMMPGLDGFQTAAILRDRHPSQRIPIIFLSAVNREDTDLARGYSHGAVDYIVKPFNPEILRSKVSVFVELFLQREEIRRQASLLIDHERREQQQERERARQAEQQAERERAQESDARFRALFDSAMDGVVVTDDAGYYVDANPAALALFGLPREELLRLRVHDVGWVKDEPNSDRAWEQFRREGQQRGQFFLACPNGETRTLDYAATAGFVKGQHLSVLRDVTEQASVHDATRRAEQRFRSLVAATSQIVWTANADGRRLEDSPSWRAFTGQTEEEWQQAGSQLSAIHPDDRHVIRQAWYDAVAARSPFDAEYRLRRADGEYRCVLLRGVPVRNDDETIREWVGTITDIEDRKRAEGEIEAGMLLREQLLAIVGHDLQNPLAAILFDSQKMLKREGLTPAESRTAARIVSTADRMSRMISQLLDLSRARMGGGIPLEVQTASLSEVCRRVIEELEVAHPERRIAREQIAELTARIDADRIAEVVSNLVGNAIQHGGKSAVTVRLREVERHAVLEVHNLGEPIPAEILPYLFDPFRRGKRETRSSSLGLGLYIAHQIVAGHRGTLTVTSTPEDGTRFTAKLPVFTADE